MQQFKIQKELEVYLDILNQVFEIEKKVDKIVESNSITRNLKRIKEIFEDDLFKETGFHLENPIGESYSDTRIDLDANVIGDEDDSLIIVEVIKPIIRIRQSGFTHLAQKGIVNVKSEKENE